MDAAELDLEDLPPKALRKLIKSMLAKKGKPNDDKQSEDADKEREQLADLHAEHKLNVPKQPVEKDDLPFELDPDAQEDDDASSETEEEKAGVKDDEAAEKKKRKKGFGK